MLVRGDDPSSLDTGVFVPDCSEPRPDLAEPFNNLAVLYARQGFISEAIINHAGMVVGTYCVDLTTGECHVFSYDDQTVAAMTRHEERRRKMAEARHRRKEKNLELKQRAIPFAEGEPVL